MATAAELTILITAKDAASKQLDAVGKSLGGLGGVGKVATAALAGVATVGVALAAGIGKSVMAAANFESAMSAVGAVSGASGTELAALSQKALALGQDTRLAGIGATDAAKAMQELAAGGVSTEDILSGAAEGALLLASAGGIDVPRAAEIATNALNQFGLSGTDAGHVADLLAGAANASSADVNDLGESLKYVGPIAKSMGLSIDDVVATLAEFGSQGIKGSQAGTALRSIIASLSKPSKQAQAAIDDLGLSFFDSSGQMKDLGGISGELKTKLSGLTDQQRANTLVTLFGNEALSAATILYGEGSEGLQKFRDQVGLAGSAADVGAKRNDNLKGSVEQLKSGLETASIVLGTAFLPLVRGIVDDVAGAVTAITPFIAKYGPDLAAGLQTGITAVVGFAKDVGGAVGAVLGAFGQLVTGQITLSQFLGGMQIFVTTVLSKLGDLAKEAGPHLQAFLGAIGSFITGTALPLLVELGKAIAKPLGDWITTTAIPFLQTNLPIWGAALWDWISGTAAPTVASKVGALASALGDWITTTAIPFLQTNLPIWGAALWDWITTTAVPAVTDAVGGLASALGTWITGTAIPFLTTNMPIWRDALVGWIRDDAVPAVVGAAQGLVGAIGNWIRGTAIPYLAENMPYWIEALRSWIADSAVPTVIGAVVGIKNALGDWVKDAADYLKEKLPQWLDAITGWITGTVIPTITGAVVGIGNALVSWIEGTAVPLSKEKMKVWSQGITDYIGSNARDAIKGASDSTLPDALNSGFTEATADGRTHAQTWMEAIEEVLRGLPTRLDTVLQPAAKKLGEWVGESLPGLALNLAKWGVLLAGFLANLPAIMTVALVAATLKLSSWIIDAVGPTAKAFAIWIFTVLAAIGELGIAIIGAVNGLAASLYNAALAIGKGIVQGIIDGILGGKTRVATAAGSLADAATESTSGHLEEKSPSKVFFRIGAMAVQGLVEGMDAGQQEAAKKAAEVASTVAKAITDTLGALKLLGGLNLGKLPSNLQVSGFLGALSDFIAQFSAVAADFEEKVLKQANLFADAAGKATGLVKNAVEGLTAIGKFTAPLGSAVSGFLASLSDFMEKFSTAAGGFEQDTLDDATAFADAAGKVGSNIGNALKGLQELGTADWAKASPTGSAMGWFTHLTASLVANFAAASKLFAEDALTEASAFADAAGKVGTATGSALAGLKALATADWAQTSPTGSAMGWFTHLTASLVANFAAASKLFADDALAAASAFAEAAGKVMGVIGPAITALTAINTLVTPPQQAVDNLLRGIRYIVGKFGEMSTTLSTEGVTQLGNFSEAAGKALGAAKTGIDLFKDFDKLVVPSKQAIDNLTIAIHYVVDRFGEMADSLNQEGIARLQAFATAAGTALTTAKTGTDLFKEMEKLSVPSKQAIDNLLAGIVYVIVRLGEIATNMGTEGLKRAQEFATGAKNVFDTVKAALDTVNSLKDYKDLPADALRAIKLGMEDAIQEMIGRANQAAALEQDADTFLGRMREAARKVAEGLALMGQAQAPAGGGGGGGGGGAGEPQLNIGLPEPPIILGAGGIVRRPTLAMIGERGPEAVVPLGRGGMGGAVYNFYISGNTMLSKDTATQQAISGIVTAAQRRTIGYSV